LKGGPVRGCINFSTDGVCSHTHAAALVWDVIKGYCTFLEAPKKIGCNLHNLIGKMWFTDSSGKRKTRSTADKAKRRKKPYEKTGRTVPQPSALETASSRDKTKHVSMSLHAT